MFANVCVKCTLLQLLLCDADVWALSMFFTLYKLYILFTLTLPLILPIIENFQHFYIFKKKKKTSLGMIYKLFSSWGTKHFLTRTRILEIDIFVPIM